MTPDPFTAYHGEPPSVEHSPTSQAAADAIAPKVNRLRALVLAAIADAGELGMTDEEIQEFMGMSPNTQRPRRVELVAAGLVRDSGRKRRTHSGRQAVVWCVSR